MIIAPSDYLPSLFNVAILMHHPLCLGHPLPRPRSNAPLPSTMALARLPAHLFNQSLHPIGIPHLLLGLALIDDAVVVGAHLLQHPRGLGGELALGAHLGPVLPEEQGERDAGER